MVIVNTPKLDFLICLILIWLFIIWLLLSLLVFKFASNKVIEVNLILNFSFLLSLSKLRNGNIMDFKILFSYIFI